MIMSRSRLIQNASFAISFSSHLAFIVAMALLTVSHAKVKEAINIELAMAEPSEEVTLEVLRVLQERPAIEVAKEALPAIDLELKALFEPEPIVPLSPHLESADAAPTPHRPQDASPVWNADAPLREPDRAQLQELQKRLRREKAQSGAVQVSLMWNNINDVDLHVSCPSGERIYFKNKHSSCGGELDVDMNVKGEELSDRPVENVYWPDGKAPRGQYSVAVQYYGNNGGGRTNKFLVRIQLPGKRPKLFGGTLRKVDQVRRVARFYVR